MKSSQNRLLHLVNLVMKNPLFWLWFQPQARKTLLLEFQTWYPHTMTSRGTIQALPSFLTSRETLPRTSTLTLKDIPSNAWARILPHMLVSKSTFGKRNGVSITRQGKQPQPSWCCNCCRSIHWGTPLRHRKWVIAVGWGQLGKASGWNSAWLYTLPRGGRVKNQGSTM